MPSKKKKFNSRFPPARIKKIMQTDEDVGKVAAAVPVIISRSLELFIESFIQKTATITRGRNAKTLSATHIKQTIHSEKTFDFLRDLVASVPDHQPEEEGDSNPAFPSCSTAQEVKKPKVQRLRKEKTGNGRGRPRKKDVVKQEVEEEKDETESGEDDEEETESEEETSNTEQFEASRVDSGTKPPVMQQIPLQPSLSETDTATTSTGQSNPAFEAASTMMPTYNPEHNPMSPRLPMLQSAPQFPNVPLMPHPQLQNVPLPQLKTIPRPQLPNIPNQMIPPQQQYPGLSKHIPPPSTLSNFSNHLPVPPNFYSPQLSQMPQYPTFSSQETFHNDQNTSFTSLLGPPPVVSQFNPHSSEGVHPHNSFTNNVQNNEPLDMSKSSQRKRSPSCSGPTETVSKKSPVMPIVAGLPNIMNMAAPKQTTEDDDYDT